MREGAEIRVILLKGAITRKIHAELSFMAAPAAATVPVEDSDMEDAPGSPSGGVKCKQRPVNGFSMQLLQEMFQTLQ